MCPSLLFIIAHFLVFKDIVNVIGLRMGKGQGWQEAGAGEEKERRQLEKWRNKHK